MRSEAVRRHSQGIASQPAWGLGIYEAGKERVAIHGLACRKLRRIKHIETIQGSILGD